MLQIFFFMLKPGKTLSARRWHASFSPDGHLDIAAVLQRIQRGVCPFLLSFFNIIVYKELRKVI